MGRITPAAYRRWYAANRQHKIRIVQRWRSQHPHKFREYYQRHRVHILDYKRQYHVQHAVERNMRTRAWCQAHVNHLRKYRRQRYLQHKDEIKSWLHARRARQIQAPGTYTATDIQILYKQQQGRCYYCGRLLRQCYTVDHKMPLSRHGTNWPSNLCLACQQCNDSKGSKTIREFMVYRQRIVMEMHANG